jgi:TetR/AcrR family transcriptional regulator, transcriptional repressor for nem operon
MGFSQTHKLATHRRILDIAAKRFRELGLNGTSIAELMKEAGLTIGGFYNHFDSKDALVVEALGVALQDLEPFESALATSPRGALRAFICDDHAERPGSNCSVSALVNDVGRGSDEVRALYTEHVHRLLALIANSLPEDDPASQWSKAIFLFSACVGSISLARAVSDPELSKRISEASLAQVLSHYPPVDGATMLAK